MTSKIISLVKKEENTAKTYGQILEEHLNLLTEEEKNIIVDDMVLCGKSDAGIFYSIINGEDLVQIVSLLEIAKNYFILSTVMGEE